MLADVTAKLRGKLVVTAAGDRAAAERALRIAPLVSGLQTWMRAERAN